MLVLFSLPKMTLLKCELCTNQPCLFKKFLKSLDNGCNMLYNICTVFCNKFSVGVIGNEYY